jgi:hypothetical protein
MPPVGQAFHVKRRSMADRPMDYANGRQRSNLLTGRNG